MTKDTLYKKLITAVFFLAVFGIAVFFYGNKLEKNNLANLISQNEKAPLEGFKNLSEEAGLAEKNNENLKADSSTELDRLLSSY